VLDFEAESTRLSVWFIDYDGPIENRPRTNMTTFGD
jgi:hypothetical protein